MTEPSRAVFLSYASQDAEPARRIYEALRAAGIEVWFDQSELRGGDAWDAAIRKQIKSCAIFIPVISRNTRVRSEGYFRLEWKLAIDRSHLMATNKTFLLPVVVDDTGQNEDAVPERFREVQWTRLPDGRTSQAFAARVLRLLLPDKPLAPPAVTAPYIAGAGVTNSASSLAWQPRLLWTVLAVAILAMGYIALDRFVCLGGRQSLHWGR